MVKEPEFHPFSPAVLQRLVRVIAAMGPHSSFAAEVSHRSELTMQLLQRRFQRFSDDWLRRVMSALRNWQVWASKHSPPFPLWNPSANQLGEYLIYADKRGPTVARGIWTQLDWVRREMGGALPTDSSLLVSFRLHAIGHLPTPADEMPPGVFLAIMYCSSNTQGAVAMFGGLVVLLAVACLRWRHQARSVVKHLNEQFITGKCLLGKSKVQGQRRAFEWRTCHGKLVCVSRFSTESSFCCRHTMSRTLTCALSSLTSRLILCHLSSVWLPKPMSDGKFMRTLRSFLELNRRPQEGGSRCQIQLHSSLPPNAWRGFACRHNGSTVAQQLVRNCKRERSLGSLC